MYFDNNDDTKALEYYQKAIKADKSSSSGSAFAFNGIGKVYLKEGKHAQALENHEKALKISQKTDDKLQIVRSLRGEGDVYASLNDLAQAFNYYNKATAIAEALKANVELKDLYNSAAILYSKKGDFQSAFQYQKYS
ncbi:MAG: tetratricopeptide repeat protein [Segetibacter sp.]